MQVNVVAEEGLKKSFECVIPAGDVASAVEQELKRVGQSVKIAGFRPGFVPIKILQQRYGKGVEADVIRNMVTDAVSHAITDKGYRAALQPQISQQQVQSNGDVKLAFSVEVLPDLPEIGFSDIELKRDTFDITDTDVDDGLQRLAKRMPKPVPLKDGEKAKDGHVVTMDFVGKVDDVAFDGGTAQGFSVELGSGRLIDGFESQLVGSKSGEKKEVKVTFPQDYFNAELAGKDAVFDVTVTEISELQVLEVDDEFARGKGFSDLRALREAVRDQLLKDLNAIVRTRMKKRLFDTLENRCEFPVPAGMVDMEFDSIWQRLQVARQQGDETVAGKTDDELRDEYRGIAERRVRLGILLAEIARKEKLQVTREELTRALIQHASQYPGQEQRVMEYYRQHPERLDELRGPILEEKAVDWIIGKVKVLEEQMSVSDLYDNDDDADESAKPKASKAKKPAAKKEAEGEEKPASKAKAEKAEGEDKAAKPKAVKKKPASE